ncbi:LysR family transcriptional regulator [Corynebacterium kalidii]|uniref:LysR family transcriptional regulator n=1 Tax=Corynebacterium kalidii TaxID=2931982 RepID=A0A9X1WMF0_9CORY|nr:LysR family transcriptional regulator [Corynebacterium kalidii]
MLNIHRLTLLREVHQRGTLAAVARELHYSPSAVSHQLSQLEREAGVPLLETAGRGVRLTEAARRLVARTDEVLTILDTAEAELASSRPGAEGTLRVTSFQSALATILPTALTMLEKRHPGLNVEVYHREVAEAFEGLAAHSYDVVIGDEFPGQPEPVRPGLHREELFADPMLLVLPTTGRWAFPAEELGGLADLADVPWILEPASMPQGRWERTVLREAGVEPRVKCETTDPILRAHMARTGHGVTVIPAVLAGPHLDHTQALAMPGSPHRQLFTAVRDGYAGHPGVRAFRTALGAAARRESPDTPETL